MTDGRLRLAARGVLVLVLLAAAGALAWREYRVYRQPVRAAVRDYLAYRRVDGLADVLAAAAREAGVDPYLLAALMIVESGGRVGARSSVDALGLFQLTMTSARWRAQVMGLAPPTEEQLLSDAELNSRLGANNLAWLLDTYDGDVVRALCAYNAGARRLKEIVDAEGGWERWRVRHENAGDSQLLAYAHRVLAHRDELVGRGTFGPIFMTRPPERFTPLADEGSAPAAAGSAEPASAGSGAPAPADADAGRGD